MAFPIVAGVEFREIADFEGYCVGSDGSVWSCLTVGRMRGTPTNASGFTQLDPDKWRQLKRSTPTEKHYSHVRLCKNCKPYTCAVHRLVLEAFRGTCPQGMEGCHNDGNRANCALDNLRWDTPMNNHADKIRHGTNGSKIARRVTLETR